MASSRRGRRKKKKEKRRKASTRQRSEIACYYVKAAGGGRRNETLFSPGISYTPWNLITNTAPLPLYFGPFSFSPYFSHRNSTIYDVPRRSIPAKMTILGFYVSLMMGDKSHGISRSVAFDELLLTKSYSNETQRYATFPPSFFLSPSFRNFRRAENN